MTHKDLIMVAYRWVLKRGSCGVAFKELYSAASNREYPDVIGFGAWNHSVLIEVKVSRSDFLKDQRKPFRKYPSKGMGRYRFYLCPSGLIKPAELPERWGLIYVSEQMKARCVVNPYGHPNSNIWRKGFDQNVEAEHALMYSALRRLHIKGHIDCIYDKQYNYNHKDEFEELHIPGTR